ncbi:MULTISPECIES: F420H2 dehydrogenase subunit FpoJ [Methanococcoides]|uniref:NADH:ubiquinone oxidoreductase subunit J n=2 Tax=Methanococcoides TaxID=2225 RepID=A0A0E3X0E2_METMT|nr:F420H2 dehydrogenase subunit FpoJ [Methanococcoides methylutens]AKB85789.1 hypothetical protein MCMEM_1736 [Methanococcoides methylutens MM1]
MSEQRPTIMEAFVHQFNPKRQIAKLLDLKVPSIESILKTFTRMIIAGLFLAVVLVSLYGTGWPAIEQLPQNVADQSNIKALGVLIFTDFVIPFEILSVVLLSSLMGAIYLAKGDDN